MAFINIGFGNIINTDKVVSIITPDSAPAKRLIQKGKEDGTITVSYTHLTLPTILRL